MMTKAAGILITLIIVGVATTHTHAARPTCPAGVGKAGAVSGAGDRTHTTGR